MKYVVLVAVVLLVLWLLRPRRRVADDAKPRRGTQEIAAEPMVVCLHCGVHLPRSDALPGRGGVFCGEAHRAAYEAAQRR
jgi:uncharacterized protein